MVNTMKRHIGSVCEYCKPSPGGIIKVDSGGYCVGCGRNVIGLTEDGIESSISHWDQYFMRICEAVASKCKCLSRQIGSVIVRDNSIVSTGYNGPARGYPHCDAVEVPADLQKELKTHYTCPRHAKGYKSGEHLDECPAGHAESNAIANAARLGVNVTGTTLYLNTLIPCKDCMILIVNAGITTVVPETYEPYHEMSIDIARYGNVTIRRMV